MSVAVSRIDYFEAVSARDSTSSCRHGRRSRRTSLRHISLCVSGRHVIVIDYCMPIHYIAMSTTRAQIAAGSAPISIEDVGVLDDGIGRRRALQTGARF